MLLLSLVITHPTLAGTADAVQIPWGAIVSGIVSFVVAGLAAFGGARYAAGQREAEFKILHTKLDGFIDDTAKTFGEVYSKMNRHAERSADRESRNDEQNRDILKTVHEMKGMIEGLIKGRGKL